MNEQDVERRLAQLGKSEPRVTPEAVDAAICGKLFSVIPGGITVCVLTLYNGLRVVGVNLGPVSPGNADPLIGEELAFKDARAKVWPILGAILAENIHRGVVESAVSARLSQADGVLAKLGYAFDAGTGSYAIDGALAAELGTPRSHAAARLSQAEGALAAMGYGYDADVGAYVSFAEDAAVAEIPVADTGGFPVEVAQPDPAEELPGPQSEGEAVDKAVDESEGQNAESEGLS